MKSRAAASLQRALLMALALVIAQYCVSAQQAARTTGPALASIESERQAGNNFHSSFASAEFAFDGGSIVRGAPFSAVAVKETTQILSDGKRVTRRTVSSLYRDSLGSTRNEWGNSAKSEGAPVPLLFDATTGAIYFINTRDRRALQLAPALHDMTQWRGKIITPQSPPDNLTQVVGETIEPLGTQVIEGVKAEGVRVTTTVPVAALAGGQAGKVIFERWYSQELRRTILIKCTDPRFGEAVFKLTAIDRHEPAAELFKIPTGYQLDSTTPGQPARSLKSSDSK